jgi:hypothetical protein
MNSYERRTKLRYYRERKNVVLMNWTAKLHKLRFKKMLRFESWTRKLLWFSFNKKRKLQLYRLSNKLCFYGLQKKTGHGSRKKTFPFHTSHVTNYVFTNMNLPRWQVRSKKKRINKKDNMNSVFWINQYPHASNQAILHQQSQTCKNSPNGMPLTNNLFNAERRMW